MEEKNSNQESEVRSQENMGEQRAEDIIQNDTMGPIMAGFDNGQVNQAELPYQPDPANQVNQANLLDEAKAEEMAIIGMPDQLDQTNQVGEYGSEERGFKQEILAKPIDLSEEQVKIMAQVVDQIDDFAMARKPDIFGNEVFSADLVMTAIRNTQHGVTFEVQNPEGFNIQGFSHIHMDRKSFPVDDDFNMSFINAPFKEPKELVVKRDGFKKYTKMRLVILMEGENSL